MKRRLIVLLGVGALALSLLIGCDGGRAPAEEPPVEVEEDVEEDVEEEVEAEVPEVDVAGDEVTLIVWESEGGPDEFIRQAGAAFTALNPNVIIEFQHVELGDTTTQIALDGPAGIGADVFAAPHDRLGELVVGGHIEAVTDPGVVTAAALSAAADAVTFDGTVFGYPVAAETYGLFFNRDLIDENDVPTTWEDLAAFVDGFEGDALPFVMDTGNIYYTILFTSTDDNRLFGPDGTDADSPNMNTDASISGMEFFQSLRSYIDIAADDLGTEMVDAQFAGGNAAMHITGPWNLANFNEAGIDFGVTTLPSLPGNDTPALSFSGTRTMFVSAYTEHPEQAHAFAAFLMSEEMQKLRNEITGALPAADITVDDTQLQGFIDQLNFAYPMPSIPEMQAFWESANATSANIWNGADVVSELNALQEAILSH
jgi:arabinogalactan oligomer/maltooligosaccharide transport system substrate-binding protein